MIPSLALPIEEGGWGTAGTLKGSVHISGGGGGSRGEGGEGGGEGEGGGKEVDPEAPVWEAHCIHPIGETYQSTLQQLSPLPSNQPLTE